MKLYFKSQISQTTKITWKRLLLAFIFIIVAAGLRVWPLEILENRLAWLTFYPAVMLSAVYGGVVVGVLATSLSCIIIVFLWSTLATQPFVNESADWLGMVVFFLTCTMISFVAEAMRRANIRAKQAQEEAQLANQVKSTFLANMSHELRTPLNAILGYSQMMQRDALISPEHREYLKTINRSGEHLLSLINEVLTIAKIESKGVTLEFSNFNLHMLIQDLQKMFQVQVNEKNIVLTIMGLAEMPKFLYGDEKKLKVILINLIGNAVKFTQKGSILVSFSFKDLVNEAVMTVVVADTGVGIVEEDIAKLFQYFVQTESGRKNGSGTGLGLAISQEYIKLMGGEISVTSGIGTGSTFRFTIKISRGTENMDQQRRQVKYVIGIKQGFSIPRILVAEDVEENRCLLVKMLSSVGFEVREAANGQETLKVFEQWQPHFIWMDIRMPVMDGLEATKRIRATKDGMQVKIVALSAHVLAGEVTEILAAGCDGFVGKPYQEYEIFETMAAKLTLEYVYRPMDSTESDLIVDVKKNYDTMSDIPQPLRGELEESLLELDSKKIMATIEKITKIDAKLGTSLKMLAKNMNYTQLLLLAQTESRIGEEDEDAGLSK